MLDTPNNLVYKLSSSETFPARQTDSADAAQTDGLFVQRIFT